MIKVRTSYLIITGLIVGIVFLPACWPFGTLGNKSKDFYIINVLDSESYQDCRIEGSINVPFDKVENFAKNLDRNTQIVIYCANYMCSASASAVQKLQEMGFKQVWAYEGGTAEWYQMGLKAEGNYPVQGACKASYLSAPNEKPEESETKFPVISAQELQEKMITRGMLRKVSQAAA